MLRRLSFLAVVAGLAAPAQAQKAADLLACVGIARDAERLACYDAAVADSSAEARAASARRAAETARIVAADAAAAAAAARIKADADAVATAAARREAFGAEGVESRGAARFAAPEGQIQTIEAAVAETLTNRSGLAVFLLDNGQMWRQVDTASLPNVRVGDKVTVARAGLGGYHLQLVRQKRRVLVKRMR